mmetsp:Transcript_54226/g.126607  ORF Transcript_54226/g.126607 Transcript_54226/m.126607 type:complete len:236 (-) Transcript_54226:2610-3317(-)
MATKSTHQGCAFFRMLHHGIVDVTFLLSWLRKALDTARILGWNSNETIGLPATVLSFCSKANGISAWTLVALNTAALRSFAALTWAGDGFLPFFRTVTVVATPPTPAAALPAAMAVCLAGASGARLSSKGSTATPTSQMLSALFGPKSLMVRKRPTMPSSGLQPTVSTIPWYNSDLAHKVLSTKAKNGLRRFPQQSARLETLIPRILCLRPRSTNHQGLSWKSVWVHEFFCHWPL